MIRRDFLQSLGIGLISGQSFILPSIFSYFFPAKNQINLVRNTPTIVVLELEDEDVFKKDMVTYTQPSINYQIPLYCFCDRKNIDFSKFKYGIHFKYKNLQNILYFDNQKQLDITLMRYKCKCFMSESAYDLIYRWNSGEKCPKI